MKFWVNALKPRENIEVVKPKLESLNKSSCDREYTDFSQWKGNLT